MEAAAAFGRSRPVVKAEKAAGDGDADGDSPSKQHLVVKMGNYGKHEHETEDKTSTSSDQKDLSCTKLQEEELESARAEMGEVREENQRLKMSLNRMMKDYEALRMQFLGIVGGEDNKKLPGDEQRQNDGQIDETELVVSLTLGRSIPAAEKKKKPADDKDQINRSFQGQEIMGDEQAVKETLSLGLNCKFEQDDNDQSTVNNKEANNNHNNSPNQSLTNNSFDQEAAKEDAGETTWPPSKGAKTMRTGDDDLAPHNNPPKRTRVCVRARCDTTTMNDGCQWRKYGQKIAKGNPCPRAYYRCTGSQTCPVRKQVQRCADDMSILITTYEGNHNHQLPVSATAMASTTSAAASMLLSGSSSSAPALNLYLSSSNNNNNNNSNSSKHNFYLPNSSISSTTTSPTHPTITLDLTSNNNNNPSSHFGKFSSSPNFPISRYPFTSQLDFGSSRHNILSWNNGFLSYNRSTNNINNHPLPTTTTNNIYQNYIQQQRNHNHNNNNVATSLPPQHALPDTIAAATKAITADPTFQSALAAALTSIINSGSGSGSGACAFVKSSRSDHPLSTTAKGNNSGCGTSFLSNIAAAAAPASTSPPAGNLVFVPANSLPYSTPKSASASPGDHIDLTN